MSVGVFVLRQASQFELNWTLLWARKNSHLGRIESVQPFSIPCERLDLVTWAAESALRMLQDEFYFERHSVLSLDRILCHPQLVSAFEAFARRLAPGFSSVDYRWAVLAIRKHQGRKACGQAAPAFERAGLARDIRASQLPQGPGLFKLVAMDRTLLVVSAQNLRRFFGGIIESPDPAWRSVPAWAAEH